MDIAALLPFLGAFKYSDEAGALGKGLLKNADEAIDEIGLIDVEYESVFDYTQGAFNKKQFMSLKNNAELQLRKRGGRKIYVDLHSQLIRAAITSIEVRLK